MTYANVPFLRTFDLQKHEEQIIIDIESFQISSLLYITIALPRLLEFIRYKIWCPKLGARHCRFKNQVFSFDLKNYIMWISKIFNQIEMPQKPPEPSANRQRIYGWYCRGSNSLVIILCPTFYKLVAWRRNRSVPQSTAFSETCVRTK